MFASKGRYTTCQHCSKMFAIDKNRAYKIDPYINKLKWFMDAMTQFENFSTVKCPECGNIFKASEARLFGVFKSPYTVFALSSLLGLSMLLISYFLFFSR